MAIVANDIIGNTVIGTNGGATTEDVASRSITIADGAGTGIVMITAANPIMFLYVATTTTIGPATGAVVNVGTARPDLRGRRYRRLRDQCL